MKKIGFVDYYLSEWHANNYPAWIAEACSQNGFEYQVAYAWGEIETSPLDGVTSAAWCEKNGVALCASVEELCEKSDVIMILAPSNPEKHLEYAKAVLPYGKTTYIDKTFAPNTQIAKEIFAIAAQYGTPVFSSSALRYAEELETEQPIRSLMVTGSGSSVDEYIVHLAEMTVKKLGVGAKQIRVEHCAKQHYFHLRYEDDREAMMVFAPKLPYTLQMTDVNGKASYVRIKSAFFPALMAAILRFFESSVPTVTAEETVEVMQICEGAVRAMNENEGWINL